MTKFSEMSPGAINGWLLYAEEHDCGQGQYAPAWYDDITGELVTYSGEIDEVSVFVTEARHTTPDELKAWINAYFVKHKDAPQHPLSRGNSKYVQGLLNRLGRRNTFMECNT